MCCVSPPLWLLDFNFLMPMLVHFCPHWVKNHLPGKLLQIWNECIMASIASPWSWFLCFRVKFLDSRLGSEMKLAHLCIHDPHSKPLIWVVVTLVVSLPPLQNFPKTISEHYWCKMIIQHNSQVWLGAFEPLQNKSPLYDYKFTYQYD